MVGQVTLQRVENRTEDEEGETARNLLFKKRFGCKKKEPSRGKDRIKEWAFFFFNMRKSGEFVREQCQWTERLKMP